MPQDAPIQSHGIRTIAFTPDGQTLVGGGEDGKVHAWNAFDGKELRTIDSGEPRVQAMHVFPDGKTVQIANKSVRILNLADGREQSSALLDLVDPKSYPRLSEFSSDGQLLVGRVGLSPGTVVVWSAVTGHIRHRVAIPGIPLAAAFSPDGKTLAIGTIATRDPPSQGAVHLYDLGAGELQRTIDVHPYSISSVAFSPDGSMLASGGEGPTQRAPNEWRRLSEVKVWNLATAYLQASHVGLIGSTCAIAYAPDGKRLASTDRERLVCEQPGDRRNWTKDFESTLIEAPPN